MKTSRSLVVLAVVLHLASGTAHAEQSQVRIAPYLWAAGFTGTLGTPTSNGSSLPGSVSDRFDTTFGDLADNLRVTGGAMLFGEWRKGPWSVFGDWTYARVESTAPSPYQGLYADVNGTIAGNLVQASLGYRLWGDAATRVDGYAGLRYYNIAIDVELTPGLAPGVEMNGDDEWLDGLIGVRVEHAFGEHWSAMLLADVGGGGSDIAWQGVAAVAYRFSWGAVTGGWRALHTDRDTEDFLLDATLSGPFFGVAFVF
jgi:hypothetical protein